MIKKLFIILLIIVFCAISYFAYTVFSKRESDLIKTSTTPATHNMQESKDASEKDRPQENIIENLLRNDATENTQTENSDQTAKNNSDDGYYVHVTSIDCARECEPYKYNDKELKYCQNVCGISDTTSTNSNCDSLNDFEKDYCYKNQAIEKKDASICDKISDTAVKRSCKNRIQEDILENM